MEGQAAAYFKYAKDAQLDWISPTATWAAEHADARIRLMAEANTRALSGVEPERQTRRQARREAADGDDDAPHRRGRVPLEPDAVPDERVRGARPTCRSPTTRTSSTRACLCDRDDPVAGMARTSRRRRSRLAEWIDGQGGDPHRGPRAPTCG